MTDRYDNRPIGVFDSGIGGLTVAAALARHLPNERLVYFGDTAHLPYGEKSPAAIRLYASEIFEFLRKKDCKAVVIACNTASAVAFESMRAIAGDTALFNVIDPTVSLVATKIKKGKVGVIATKTTVNSGVYSKRIRELNPELQVSMLATPLLVAMIEEGFFNNSISSAIIADYLSKPKLENLDALILGCTHFPLIKSEIRAYYGSSIPVIDSSDIVAKYVGATLEKLGLFSSEKKGHHEFYVSDLTESFRQSTSLFFGTLVSLQEVTL
ncbi:MAG TPA: glutamate racemase [Cryomorphaceae bacterium]|nr:glutamate racemase [Cryomorphaceae bacterium]